MWTLMKVGDGQQIALEGWLWMARAPDSGKFELKCLTSRFRL